MNLGGQGGLRYHPGFENLGLGGWLCGDEENIFKTNRRASPHGQSTCRHLQSNGGVSIHGSRLHDLFLRSIC